MIDQARVAACCIIDDGDNDDDGGSGDHCWYAEAIEKLYSPQSLTFLSGVPRSIDHSLEHCATSTPLRATSLLF